MPASVTHTYFAKDVYDILPKNIQTCLSIPRLKMFGQSTDSLLFYHLFSLKRGKSIRKFQHTFHTTKTQEFFITLINYIKSHRLEKDIDTCSFLCGFICHYILDSTVHPFVFYKTGKFNKKDSTTYKYNNLHLFMETYIDNYLIKKREGRNPYTFPITKFCFDLKPFSQEMQNCIQYSFKEVFHIDYMHLIYYQSLKDMRFSLRVFRHDSFGVKKFFYKLADTFTPRNCFRFEAISYHYPLDNKYDFLNFKRTLWRNPTTYSITSRDSFYDLYIKSLKLAKKTIEDTFHYLNGKNIDLNQLFTNLSYVTGLSCDSKKELKYFEF